MRATYRLQLSSDFGFADARSLVPYLRDLGISHLYLSPSLQARRGSTHGYDVVDPRQFSRELGGPEELRALSGSARDAGMGIVVDVVPNHMAADDQNRYWADPELRAKFFDIEPETDAVPWETFANSSGNPLVPTLREAIDDVLTEREAAEFEAHLRPLVEQGHGRRHVAAAFLWATKAS